MTSHVVTVAQLRPITVNSDRLALRAGQPFEDLLAERILRPLGLADTGIALPADQAARLAPGYTARRRAPADPARITV